MVEILPGGSSASVWRWARWLGIVELGWLEVKPGTMDAQSSHQTNRLNMIEQVGWCREAKTYLQEFIVCWLCLELLGCFGSGFEVGGGHGEDGSRVAE
jgi:hypothetical protein